MSPFINLGTAAVLDAKKLHVGDHIELNGELAIVDRIEDEQVFLKVLTWQERLKYRFFSMWRNHKFSILGTLMVGIGVLIYHFLIR